MNMPDSSTLRWRKSRRSTDTGGACVEVADLAVQWRKSRLSGDTGGDCVEVASIAPAVAVRDSKDPHGPKLVLNETAWRGLASEIKAGAHDLA
jgi:hypothetical protein